MAGPSQSLASQVSTIFLYTIWPLDSSVDKESDCNAGDHGLIPGLGRSTGEGIGYSLQYSWASLVAQLEKSPPAMWVDLGSIPGLERSPGEWYGYPLQYSGLDKSMDYYSRWARQRVGHY